MVCMAADNDVLQDSAHLIIGVVVLMALRLNLPLLAQQGYMRDQVESLEELTSCGYMTLLLIILDRVSNGLGKRSYTGARGQDIVDDAGALRSEGQQEAPPQRGTELTIWLMPMC